MGTKKIDNWFVYHPVRGDQGARYERIRAEARAFALEIVALTPAGPDQDLAIQKLREVVFFANASIACGEVDDPDRVYRGLPDLR